MVQIAALTEGEMRKAKKPHSKAKPKKSPPSVSTKKEVPVSSSYEQVIDFAYKNSKNFSKICELIAVELSKKNPNLFLELSESIDLSNIKEESEEVEINQPIRFNFTAINGLGSYEVRLTNSQIYSVGTLIEQGKYVNAIKAIREFSGAGLKEAKMICDYLKDFNRQTLMELTKSAVRIIQF